MRREREREREREKERERNLGDRFGGKREGAFLGAVGSLIGGHLSAGALCQVICVCSGKNEQGETNKIKKEKEEGKIQTCNFSKYWRHGGHKKG